MRIQPSSSGFPVISAAAAGASRLVANDGSVGYSAAGRVTGHCAEMYTILASSSGTRFPTSVTTRPPKLCPTSTTGPCRCTRRTTSTTWSTVADAVTSATPDGCAANAARSCSWYATVKPAPRPGRSTATDRRPRKPSSRWTFDHARPLLPEPCTRTNVGSVMAGAGRLHAWGLAGHLRVLRRVRHVALAVLLVAFHQLQQRFQRERRRRHGRVQVADRREAVGHGLDREVRRADVR